MFIGSLFTPALGFACTAGLAISLIGGHPVGAADGAVPPGDPVVARVDGIELHLSDVQAAQQNLPPQAQKLPLDQIYPALLDRLVDGALITEAGRKEHIEQDPELQSRLKRYEDRLIQETYLNRTVKQAETEDRLKLRYQTLLKEKPAHEEVHASHILLATEAEAKSVIAELDKGADFDTLARKYSTDSDAGPGGDLGYFAHDEMVAEFADAAFALPAGQYTRTPVKTEFGWHVIKVQDHRLSKPPNFEEALDELNHDLAAEIIDAKLQELRGAAKIETFGLDGKPLTAGK